MNEKLKAVREYLKYFPKDKQAQDNALKIEFEEELGITVPPPNAEIIFGMYKLSELFTVSKTYDIVNHATKYKHNNKDTLVIWHPVIGRLHYADTEYWYAIDKEWSEFLKTLKSYNPVDYDKINDTYVYDLENGKKLLADYENIESRLKENIALKIKAVNLTKKKEQLKKLQREIEETENE